MTRTSGMNVAGQDSARFKSVAGDVPCGPTLGRRLDMTDLGHGVYLVRADSETWKPDEEVGGLMQVLFERATPPVDCGSPRAGLRRRESVADARDCRRPTGNRSDRDRGRTNSGIDVGRLGVSAEGRQHQLVSVARLHHGLAVQLIRLAEPGANAHPTGGSRHARPRSQAPTLPIPPRSSGSGWLAEPHAPGRSTVALEP